MVLAAFAATEPPHDRLATFDELRSAGEQFGKLGFEYGPVSGDLP